MQLSLSALLSVRAGVTRPCSSSYEAYQSRAEGTSRSGSALPTEAVTLTPVGISASIGCEVSERCFIRASVLPSQQTLPLSSSITRFAADSNPSSRCSATIIVVPSSLFILIIRETNCAEAIGSSCDSGSSSSSTSGFIAMTDAKFIICFCPPDSLSQSQ